MQPWTTRSAGLVIGFAADRLVADPQRYHPVAGFGQLAAALEARIYRPSRRQGTVYTCALVAAIVGAGTLAERLAARRPLLHASVTAVSTWAVLGGTSLAREATAVHKQLDRGDLDAAREQVTHLVGRDPRFLDSDGVARATVESVAENTSDAVVAPLLAGAVGGVPGLVGYRALNTLDAMVGHRSDRYVKFGWAAARADDVANLVPARVTAGLACLGASRVDGSGAHGLRSWWRDAARHPSPNAGPVEAAFAGALGVQLGGVNTYGEVTEDRGTLGDGPAPRPEDIARAVRLASLVGWAALGLSAVIPAVVARRRRY